jgi:hypothetical protein
MSYSQRILIPYNMKVVPLKLRCAKCGEIILEFLTSDLVQTSVMFGDVTCDQETKSHTLSAFKKENTAVIME